MRSLLEVLGLVGSMLELGYGFRFECVFAAAFAAAGVLSLVGLAVVGDGDGIERVLFGAVWTVIPAALLALLWF